MTPTDPTPPDTLELGKPARGGQFQRRNLVAGLATLALLAAAATGVALASTSSTPSPSGSTASPNSGTQKQEGTGPGPGGRQRGPGGMRGVLGFGGPMGALHGEFVVPRQGGGYQTIVVQRGAVSSVSSSTITVKSDDGFSATYAVGADALVNAARNGIGSIKKGDELAVLAQQKSGNDAALTIADLTRWQGLRDKFGHDRGPDNDGTPPTGAPSPSTGSTGSTGSSSFGV